MCSRHMSSASYRSRCKFCPSVVLISAKTGCNHNKRYSKTELMESLPPMIIHSPYMFSVVRELQTRYGLPVPVVLSSNMLTTYQNMMMLPAISPISPLANSTCHSEEDVSIRSNDSSSRSSTTPSPMNREKSPRSCPCPVCGKNFTRHWLLQGHLRTHTGEKPFKCEQCGKAFADKSNLRAHTQTHSGVKPYNCSRCGKRFALRSYLSKHEESSCSKMPVFPYSIPK